MTFCFVIIEYFFETPFPNECITLMHSYLQYIYIYTGSCNMNAFFWSFYGLHTILHTLNLGCSFRTLREPCNNQRPRCDIACLHVINHSYHG